MKAADQTKSNKLSAYLKKQGVGRETFANELLVKLRTYNPNEKIDNYGSVSGKMHIGWILNLLYTLITMKLFWKNASVVIKLQKKNMKLFYLIFQE